MLYYIAYQIFNGYCNATVVPKNQLKLIEFPPFIYQSLFLVFLPGFEPPTVSFVPGRHQRVTALKKVKDLVRLGHG